MKLKNIIHEMFYIVTNNTHIICDILQILFTEYDKI